MDKPLVADTDPDFLALSTGLRDMIRQFELDGREIMENGFSTLPGELRELLRGMGRDVMPHFIYSQLAFYKIVDLCWPIYQAELAKRAAIERALTPRNRLN